MPLTWYQCCGSMTIWCGSGSWSADPCLWQVDPDSELVPDPAFFVIDLQDANKKLFFKVLMFFTFEGTFIVHHFSWIWSEKKSQNSGNQGFSYYFCLMIERSGSGSRAGSGSGSIPLTSGSRSESGRPKNMWIRIGIRNRIRNTDQNTSRPHRATVHLIRIIRWASVVFRFLLFQVCCAARYGHPGLHLLRPLLHAGEPGQDGHTHRLSDPMFRDKKRWVCHLW